MSRKPLMAGNWKMHNTVGESLALARKLARSVGQVLDRDVLICPGFAALKPVSEAIAGTHIRLGAQNLYPAAQGAFTGEVSPAQIKDAGADWVIIGHSERRHVMGEGDEFINRKVKSALEHGLWPILCVGEKLDERQAGKVNQVVESQLAGGLAGVNESGLEKLVVAYEPVWAIGTGHTATPAQAQEVHALVRRWLAVHYSGDAAARTRILYGGSVKPDNIDDLMAQSDIDGALVGGASLKADDFARIVRFKSS